jgi:Tetratricopeptide Repeats-Sensor/Adenylate and Guanylate cyclase catalytic domain
VPEPVTAWVERVRDAERRGELLAAFDLAERGLAEHPEDLWLRHRAVLALARAGSTDEAQRRFTAYGLASVDDEDVQALSARIAKDVALSAQGVERRQEARRAAELYAEIFERTGGYYPGVNAATLMLVAGAADEARVLAERMLGAIAAEDASSYYVAASEAEALLVLGRGAEARLALARAMELCAGDFGALSTTRRQLRLVCRESGFDEELLSVIAGPSVVHYCGHRIAPEGGEGRFPASAEPLVRARIVAEIARDRPGFAYGSLASGSDILFAEALLAAGAELHVVLPFASAEFVESSVADGGPGWVKRFEACLAAAMSVSYATDDAFLDDDVLYRYASELAMGLAVLRARFLDAPVRQIAVWDGGPAGGDAGTAVDVATWARHGYAATNIPPVDLPSSGTAAEVARTNAGESGRVVRALLFSDIREFSKLTDEQLPRFAGHVLGVLAGALDRHEAAIEYRETWGDAIYVVLTDPASAAACALDLQDAMESLNLAALRLPEHLALRLGGHVGPVFPVRNPIMGTPGFMGSHVSRTARIEPVTPAGEVYVTEQFAAALVLENSPYACDYVGHLPAAKDYGNLRMYRLRRR